MEGSSCRWMSPSHLDDSVELQARKSPALAGVLSGIMPGLGQLYCGQWKKGAAFLIAGLVMDAALGVSAGFLRLLQTGPIGLTPDEAAAILLRSLPFLALALWSVLDAVRTAKRSIRI